MGFIKNIARKILYDEIERIREESKRFENRNIELRGKIAELEAELTDKGTEVAKVDSERILAEKKTKDVEKENEILREYYDLDKEPSDEIKMKIHIDLEVNRLKEEKMQLIAMYKQPMVIPQPIDLCL